ncbi:MAG TPA: SpoIIE family protein phosphatase [Terracidiphilus sp.]|nr:SpoIIE family protein phosphatase [Terracidiphilus sp.]
MPKAPDQNADGGSTDESIVFVERGISHSFQYEGTGSGSAREGLFFRLNFVSVYVTDQERSLRFFVNSLGFRLAIDTHFPSGYRWIEVAPPDGTARLALILPAAGFVEAGRPGQSSLITFMTEDVEAKYREWSDRGVKFTSAPHTPEWGGLFCQFEDPDGNPFGLAGFNEVAQALEARRKAEQRRREEQILAARELEIAQQVQARLLPQKLPVIAGLDCGGICLQARSVGGDYYDFIELGQGRLAVVVSDVAGKGIGAALLMAHVQASFHHQSVRIADHPEEVLVRINRTLFESTESRSYVTLFLGEYDSASGCLRFANCGHLPGLLLHGDEVRKLSVANTVIGLFESWECSIAESTMMDGDVLVLYTDGVTEAPGPSEEEFGEVRLLELLRKKRALAATALAEEIANEVVRFSGAQQFDDITVVVLKKIG